MKSLLRWREPTLLGLYLHAVVAPIGSNELNVWPAGIETGFL